jgi:hypothetical protein
MAMVYTDDATPKVVDDIRVDIVKQLYLHGHRKYSKQEHLGTLNTCISAAEICGAVRKDHVSSSSASDIRCMQPQSK